MPLGAFLGRFDTFASPSLGRVESIYSGRALLRQTYAWLYDRTSTPVSQATARRDQVRDVFFRIYETLPTRAAIESFGPFEFVKGLV